MKRHLRILWNEKPLEPFSIRTEIAVELVVEVVVVAVLAEVVVLGTETLVVEDLVVVDTAGCSIEGPVLELGQVVKH